MIIEVPINKSKAIKRFIIFLLLLILFTAMAIRPQLFTHGNSFGFIKVAGYIGTFIFILCTAFVAQKVFNKKPGLIIDNDGIVDNSLGVMFPKQVTGFKHLKNGADDLLAIEIKNPEAYIEKEINSVKRKMLELNYSTLKTPVNIAASRLRMNFDELYATIMNAYKKQS